MLLSYKYIFCLNNLGKMYSITIYLKLNCNINRLLYNKNKHIIIEKAIVLIYSSITTQSRRLSN